MGQKEGQRPGRGLITQFLVAIVKYVFATVVIFITALGCTTLYDITIGDEVPLVSNLGRYSPEYEFIHQSPNDHMIMQWDDDRRWQALQRPLKILDRVCPESSQWVRDRYQSGNIIWETEYTGCHAKFNYIDRDLTINVILFTENNGEIASILAHEFRHSRQNFTKFFREIIACLILREAKPSIVEDDAELFESKVLVAIFD